MTTPSASKVTTSRGPAIERDEYFEAKHPLSVHARAARYKKRIAEEEGPLSRFTENKGSTSPAFLAVPE